jgi:DNA-binding NarL/FixJ family response regulator
MTCAAMNHHPHLDVAICDRREFDRAALRALCSSDHDLSVVAEVEQPDQLTQALAACVQLVILIGRSMLRGGGDQLERIRRDLPQARIVVVGVSDEWGAAGVPPGADGFLPRDGELAAQLAAVNGI